MDSLSPYLIFCKLAQIFPSKTRLHQVEYDDASDMRNDKHSECE